MASDSLLPDLRGKIGLTLAHLFAIGLCLARSYLRVKKDRVWWDDWMVLGAAALDLVYMLTLWVKSWHPQVEIDGVAYRNAWLLYFFGYAATWLARVSLWLSLARIYAPPQKTRRLAFILAATFSVLGTLSTISAVFGCYESKWGARLRVDRCFSGMQALAEGPLYVKLSVVVAFVDSLCDITLVVVPVYLLSNVRLERKRKMAIIFLGSGSLMPTLFVMISVIVVLVTDPAKHKDVEVLSNTLIHIATILVLISANILVVGAAIYGRIEQRAVENHSVGTDPINDWPSPPGAPNIKLTRISTSRYDIFMTGVDDELDVPQEDYLAQETRPLFWSLVDRRERENAEPSVAQRMTV